MSSWTLSVHAGLRSGSRLPALSREESSVRMSEWAVWLAMGITAACASALPDWNLRIPGHAILRSVFPMALGLSLAPRRGAGGVMGVIACATALTLRFSGRAEVGFGALTSLSLTGPLLDVALWKAQAGWRLYAGIIAAGLSSNLIAMGIKVTEKLMMGGGGKRSFGAWLAQAAWTYPLCGVLAGLLSAVLWFRFVTRSVSEGGRPQKCDDSDAFGLADASGFNVSRIAPGVGDDPRRD